MTKPEGPLVHITPSTNPNESGIYRNIQAKDGMKVRAEDDIKTLYEAFKCASLCSSVRVQPVYKSASSF